MWSAQPGIAGSQHRQPTQAWAYGPLCRDYMLRLQGWWRYAASEGSDHEQRPKVVSEGKDHWRLHKGRHSDHDSHLVLIIPRCALARYSQVQPVTQTRILIQGDPQCESWSIWSNGRILAKLWTGTSQQRFSHVNIGPHAIPKTSKLTWANCCERRRRRRRMRGARVKKNDWTIARVQRKFLTCTVIANTHRKLRFGVGPWQLARIFSDSALGALSSLSLECLESRGSLLRGAALIHFNRFTFFPAYGIDWILTFKST